MAYRRCENEAMVPLATFQQSIIYFFDFLMIPTSKGRGLHILGWLETSAFAYKDYKRVSRCFTGVARIVSSWRIDFNLKHHMNRSVANTSPSSIYGLTK